MNNLKYIKPISWEDVFLIWASGEADLPRWIEHYKSRGFSSWEEWRKNSVKDLNPEKLKWDLYEVIDPLKTVPGFRAGPFRAWMKKYYGDKEMPPFKDLAKNLELQNLAYVSELIKNFPKESTIIGLVKDKEIIVIEGMHRCSALAVANEKNITMNFKLFLILAEFLGDIPVLGQINSPTWTPQKVQ